MDQYVFVEWIVFPSGVFESSLSLVIADYESVDYGSDVYECRCLR